MERRLPLALFVCWLVLPTLALGSEGPRVPNEALARVPPAVQAEWARREYRVAQMTRELEAQRSELAVQRSLDTLRAARQGLRGALTEATNLGVVARSQLQVVRLGRVEARIDLDTARLEQRLAIDALRSARGHGRPGVRAAKARRAEARDRIDAAYVSLAAAREAEGRTQRIAERQLGVAERAMTIARQALNEVGPIRSGVVRRRISAPELDLLEARRDLAAAALEHDRAMAAITAGARIRLRPFLTALDEARAAEDTAREALVRAASASARRAPVVSGGSR